MTSESFHNAEEYSVGWICALPIELAASTQMLDERHQQVETDLNDDNTYMFGRIGDHNVVIGCLAAGQTGLVSAHHVAMHMKNSFRSLRIVLMVGIGGGVPLNDMHLGDVVVSQPHGEFGGVVQYDMGITTHDGGSIRTGALNAPPIVLLTALAAVQAAELMEEFDLTAHLSKLGNKYKKFAYPGLPDRLFKAEYKHKGGKTCSNCSDTALEYRDPRPEPGPVTHYGTIASGSQVMKDGISRDRISSALGGEILCFEMEAAGLMNNFPCLIIRGISDYADSHKNDAWIPYASATAAAFAKEFLRFVQAKKVASTPTLDERMQNIAEKVAENSEISHRVERKISTAEENEILDWLSDFNFSSARIAAQDLSTPGTGEWLLESFMYRSWRDSSHGLLWLHGAAGCGKTILSSTIINDLHQKFRRNATKIVAYWYFQFSNITTQNVHAMLRSLLRQLSSSTLHPAIKALSDAYKRFNDSPSMEELKNALCLAIDDQEKEFFLVLDALDECPYGEHNDERPKLLKLLEELVGKNFKNLHLLVTSRPEPDIRNSLRPITLDIIDIEPMLKNDVSNFVNTATCHHDLEKWGPEIVSGIRRELLSREERRFRWVDLQIRRLKQCLTETDVEEALKTIPETLEATYHNAFERVPEREKGYVSKIMKWLAVSLTPMNPQQIAATVGFKSPDDVLRVCTSLLVAIIDDEVSQTIKLAHFSVKEYVILDQQKEDGLYWYRFSSQVAHSFVATTAVDYLLNPKNLVEPGSNIDDKPLLEYSASYWYKHISELGDTSPPPELQAKIDLMFDDSNSQQYLNWLSIHNPESSYTKLTKFPQPLYYASFLGLTESVRNLCKDKSQLRVAEGELRNALNAASVEGHVAVIKTIAEALGGIQDVLDFPFVLRTIRRNFRQTLRTLLEYRYSSEVTEGMLIDAMSNSQNVQVMEVLLEQKPDLNISAKLLVEVADASLQAKPLMQWLLKKRPDLINIVSERVLEEVAENWNEGMELMQWLLAQRADLINFVSEKVLQAAAENPKNGKTLLEWFLDHRPDLTLSKRVLLGTVENWNHGTSPLQLLEDRKPDILFSEDVLEAAAGNSNEGTVLMQWLLDRKPGLTISEKVLQAAARNWGQGLKLTQWLFDKRPDLINNISERVIIAAASNVRMAKEVMQWLLSQKPDLSISERILRTAMRNSKQGKEIMYWLFDEQPGLINLVSDGTLQAATSNDNGGVEMLEWLLNRKPSLVVSEKVFQAAAGNWKQGRDLLEWLLSQKYDMIITEKVLRAAGTNWNQGKDLMIWLVELKPELVISERVLQTIARAYFGHRVMEWLVYQKPVQMVHVSDKILQAAIEAYRPSMEMVELILDHPGSTVSVTEEVLKVAAFNPDLDSNMMEWLLNRGQVEHITHGVLEAAAMSGQIERLVTLAAKQGVEPDARLAALCQLFHCVIEGDVKTVESLLADGVDPDTRDIHGRSLLWLSMQGGHEDLAKILLERDVDVNVKDHMHGYTPLHLAVDWENHALIDILLGAGADPRTEAHDGETPINLADESLIDSEILERMKNIAKELSERERGDEIAR